MNPTIEDAKLIAKARGLGVCIVIGISPEGISGASYGISRALCQEGGRVLDQIMDKIESGEIEP